MESNIKERDLEKAPLILVSLKREAQLKLSNLSLYFNKNNFKFQLFERFKYGF